MSQVDDFVDENDDFVSIPISTSEHYLNIVMPNRDVKYFKEANPDFFYTRCDKDCMKHAHTHAVHGYYTGSVVFGVQCAPPLYLHPTWQQVEKLDAENVRMIDAAVERANRVFQPIAQAVAAEAHEAGPAPAGGASASGLPVDISGNRVTWGGAQTLKDFIDDPDTKWVDVLGCFRDPESAKWASAKLLTPSRSGQNKIKKAWNERFQAEIKPMIQGAGSPMKDVLVKLWDMDSTEGKVVSNYLMRRLVQGELNVVEDHNGNIYMAGK